MPSKTDSAAAQGPEPDGFDNYFLEEFGDPFGSPEPEPAKNKRKEPEGLGIDEEVSVAKKPRVPRIKLDEDRYGPTKAALPRSTAQAAADLLVACCPRMVSPSSGGGREI